MRLIRLLALPAVVAGLLVFGATYDVPEPPPPRLSGVELAWIGALRGWLRTPLPERCRAEPVAAPTGRLDDVRDDFVAACRETEPARMLARSRDARARLAAQLLDRRSLAVSGGLVGTSRVEPRLSAVMTRLAGGRPVEVRCWSQADWRSVRAEEEALTGARPSAWYWLPRERLLQLQGVDCGPLVLLARGGPPSARGRRTDLALSLWTAAAAAEAFSRQACVTPAVLATSLGAPRGEAVDLVRWARAELAPLLPGPSRRCRTSRPS